MSSQVDRVVSIFRTLAQIPALTSAKICNNGLTVGSIWSQRILERNKPTKICVTQTLNSQLETVAEDPFGVDVSSEIMSAISPQENLRAIVKEQTDAKDVKKQYLEIWKYRHLQHCIDLPALEIHGDVYADTEFGDLNWDKEEKRVLYVAERKLPKSEPFYKRQSAKSKSKNSKDDETPPKGNEYAYKQEWGEQLVGKHLSSIIIFQLETETFTVVDWLSPSWCPGQVMWSPDSESIVGVAWETEPRRLGLIFCTNRPGYIFSTTLDGTITKISAEGNAVRSPRFSSNGDYLVWLQRTVGGPHHACHQIVKTAWPLEDTPKVETVIDIIDKEIPIEDGKSFTGVYAQGFPKRCFSTDGKRLLFSTAQKTEVRSYVVDIDTGKITDISDESFPCSTTVIDVHQDIILAARSSMKQPSQLIIARLPKAGEEGTIVWKLLSKESVPVPEEVISATVKYMDLVHENVNEPVKDFTALFMGGPQTEGLKQPLIVWPHGGPHSSFTNSYSLESALYTMLGFAIVQINFRGSTGAGQTNVEYLASRVGDVDVRDCILATDKAVQQFSIDKDRCVLIGRSHGGFLVTHLSGQFPDKYAAVVAGNPVTDVATMINSTDIPDCVHSFNSGFSMLQVNYCGSAGLGQDNLLSLPGNIGVNDTGDCMLAMTTLMIENQSSFSHKVAYGKSHGGYLVTLLVGLHPEVFSAAVAKNPVTELVSKYNTTDIPDSCAYEAGAEFNEVGPVSEELLLAMRRGSPLAYAHNVRAPTLLLLGSKDKRVPIFQGLEFYQKIKANGCKARVLVYEDNHALSTGAVEVDHVINGALWLLEHTQ